MRVFKKILLGLVVIIFCFIFASQNPFWLSDEEKNMRDMDIEDIELTILNDSTIRIENLINGDYIYGWNISNSYEKGYFPSGEMVFSSEYDLIEIYYEDLDELSFQAIIVNDGIEYTSNTFYVNSDGEISQIDELSDSSETEVDSLTKSIDNVTSLAYLCFLFVVVLLFYLLSNKFQMSVLLIASIIFYTASGVQYMLFVLFSSIITFVVAKQLSGKRSKQDKELLGIALIGTLGVMVVIKYCAFTISNINALLHTNIPIVSLIMPLGLSFYTFVLISYIMDVYRGKYVAEKKFLKLFTFISFFPHISQGPLSKYNELSSQFEEKKKFEYKNMCFALQRILWGFFTKLVLADRIGTLISGVFSNYETQSGSALLIASMLYSIQIYADFYGSMEIAIGSAQLFGIKLQENFMRPYFSTNMPEFWRRWHISLGVWFKEYVFYPISISKLMRNLSVKSRRKYGMKTSRIVAAIPPIMSVWLLTGLWHGASWNFVAWGVFHGILILLSTIFSLSVQQFVVKIGINTENMIYKVLQMFKVFMLCTIGRIFFRATSIKSAVIIFNRIFTLTSGENNLIPEEITFYDIVDYAIPLGACILLFVVSIIQENKGDVRNCIYTKSIVIRWIIWISIICAVVIFGISSTTQSFIYEAF